MVAVEVIADLFVVGGHEPDCVLSIWQVREHPPRLQQHDEPRAIVVGAGVLLLLPVNPDGVVVDEDDDGVGRFARQDRLDVVPSVSPGTRLVAGNGISSTAIPRPSKYWR